MTDEGPLRFDGEGTYIDPKYDTPRDPLAAHITHVCKDCGAEITLPYYLQPDATRPSGDAEPELYASREYRRGWDAALRATRPSGDEALPRNLHDQRWACSEDRDSCDPAVNPAFHDSQLASIGLLSATALSGYGSTSATAPNGSPSVVSGGSPSGDEALPTVDDLSVALQRGGALSSHFTYHDLARCVLAALRDGRDDLGAPDEHRLHVTLATPSSTPDVEGLDGERLARAIEAWYMAPFMVAVDAPADSARWIIAKYRDSRS